MMRKVLVLALVCLPLIAQPSLVTVQDTIYTLTGAKYTGWLTINLSPAYIPGGSPVVLGPPTRIYITNGFLNTQLVGNGSSGSFYVLTFGTGANMNCTFPTSGTSTLGASCSVGSSNQVLVNNGGMLAGFPGFTWNNGTSVLAVTGTVQATVLQAPVYQTTLATPASSSAACTAGSIWADASFVYVCTALNTIKRAALTSF